MRAIDSAANLDPTPASATWTVNSGDYPRPAGAAKIRATLVPAHQACTSPDSSPGPPLEQESCAVTGLSTDNLTVPDDDSTLHNGSTTLRVQCTNGGTPPSCDEPGDQADVAIAATTNDVRCASTALAQTACGSANESFGSDYAGVLLLRLALRITDAYNGSSSDEAATVADAAFTVGVPCTGTGDEPSRGSSCSIDTSADALVAGFAREDARAGPRPG